MNDSLINLQCQAPHFCNTLHAGSKINIISTSSFFPKCILYIILPATISLTISHWKFLVPISGMHSSNPCPCPLEISKIFASVQIKERKCKSDGRKNGAQLQFHFHQCRTTPNTGQAHKNCNRVRHLDSLQMSSILNYDRHNDPIKLGLARRLTEYICSFRSKTCFLVEFLSVLLLFLVFLPAAQDMLTNTGNFP